MTAAANAPARDERSASREAALQRMRAAMEHVECAQRELDLACADLCSIIGAAPAYGSVAKLRSSVHKMWWSLERLVYKARGAAIVGTSSRFILDSPVQPTEHAHSGCGNRTDAVRSHGLLRVAPALAPAARSVIVALHAISTAVALRVAAAIRADRLVTAAHRGRPQRGSEELGQAIARDVIADLSLGARPPKPLEPDCPTCQGTGWTEAGWAARAEEADPFAGDCTGCGGTGRISEAAAMAHARAGIRAVAEDAASPLLDGAATPSTGGGS